MEGGESLTGFFQINLLGSARDRARTGACLLPAHRYWPDTSPGISTIVYAQTNCLTSYAFANFAQTAGGRCNRARGRRSRAKSALSSNKLRKTEQTGCVVTQQPLKRALDVALDVRCAPAVVQLRARIDIHNRRYAAGKRLHVPVDS